MRFSPSHFASLCKVRSAPIPPEQRRPNTPTIRNPWVCLSILIFAVKYRSVVIMAHFAMKIGSDVRRSVPVVLETQLNLPKSREQHLNNIQKNHSIDSLDIAWQNVSGQSCSSRSARKCSFKYGQKPNSKLLPVPLCLLAHRCDRFASMSPLHIPFHFQISLLDSRTFHETLFRHRFVRFGWTKCLGKSFRIRLSEFAWTTFRGRLCFRQSLQSASMMFLQEAFHHLGAPAALMKSRGISLLSFSIPL